jgi:hypothetical protein
VRIAAQRKISHHGLKKNSIMLAVEARWVTLLVVDARARPKIVWGLFVTSMALGLFCPTQHLRIFFCPSIYVRQPNATTA